MIKFMVLGPPRSGTAWASVWLSAYHDPLWDHFYEDLDGQAFDGVCCTGLAMHTTFLSNHPAKKVILHRSESEINYSLKAIGCGACDPSIFKHLESIQGLHVHWTSLFDVDWAYKIWCYVKDVPFDYERHRELIALKITTKWQLRARRADPAVIRRYAQHGILVKPQNPLDDI